MKQILKLLPIGKDYLWGGEQLKTIYGKQIALSPLAETWEFAAHPDGNSTVKEGRFAGLTLQQLFDQQRALFGPKYAQAKTVPIMIKFIDAAQNLSVQVHPDDAYAQAHEHQPGKSEFWYVLNARQGAKLIYGCKHALTPELLKQAANDGTLEKHLHFEKVRPGDGFYIPAGTIHGIGAGITILEIQENSNVTYRLYDYNRVDKNGHKRPLHLDQAAAVANLQPAVKLSTLPAAHLCECPYFVVDHVTVCGANFIDLGQDNFTVLVCTEGYGCAVFDTECCEFTLGETMLVPYEIKNLKIYGNCQVVIVRC